MGKLITNERLQLDKTLSKNLVHILSHIHDEDFEHSALELLNKVTHEIGALPIVSYVVCHKHRIDEILLTQAPTLQNARAFSYLLSQLLHRYHQKRHFELRFTSAIHDTVFLIKPDNVNELSFS